MSLRIAVSSCFLLVSAGCTDPNVPVPVRGVVKVDGEPLAGAAVQFVPESDTGQLAFAETKEDGSYDLMTGGNPGALPGEYKVTISWEQGPPLWTQYRDGAPMKEELRKKYYADGEDKKPVKKSPVPPDYAAAATTPLKQSVPAADGVANFDVPGNGK